MITFLIFFCLLEHANLNYKKKRGKSAPFLVPIKKREPFRWDYWLFTLRTSSGRIMRNVLDSTSPRGRIYEHRMGTASNSRACLSENEAMKLYIYKHISEEFAKPKTEINGD